MWLRIRAFESGEAGLIRELAAQRADVSARVEGLNHLGYWDGETLLMVAAKSRQQATVLRALMDRRADANATCVSVTGSIITAAWLATRPEHVRALLDYRADLAARHHFSSCFAGLAPLKWLRFICFPSLFSWFSHALARRPRRPCSALPAPLRPKPCRPS